MSDQKLEAERLFEDAIAMPDGMPRHEAIERAARAADAAGHDKLAATCRMAMIDSCYQLNRYDLMLAPIAWCRAAEQRDPTVFSEDEMHGLHWAHKWVPSGLLRDPRFGLHQINSVLNDLEARYLRAGFSLQPVHSLRAEVADHIGDLDAAERHFARFMAAERDEMSDCAACVIEEQVRYLVRRGRHDEAIRHAEPALRGEFRCSTQPQGILTSLLPALLAVGDLDRARDAHLFAYRQMRDRISSGTVYAHLKFCATTGNVHRGMDILGHHLDRVHHSTSPSGAMYFAAAAALLLGRLDDDQRQRVELAVPQQGGIGTRRVTAEQLRGQLESSARELASAFDRRNGTPRQSERIEALLTSVDTTHVPLAVPAPSMPATAGERIEKSEQDSSTDPTELAARAKLAYETGDFFTGYRLMSSLPADLNPLLPEELAAYLDARRAMESADDNADRARVALGEAVERLRAAGDRDSAARFLARLGSWCGQDGDLEQAVRLGEHALTEADEHGQTSTRVLARLMLSELLDYRHEHEQAERHIDTALTIAEQGAREQLPGARLMMAEHRARQQDFDAADEMMAEVLGTDALPPSVLFHGLLAHTYVAAVRQDMERAMETSARLVDLARMSPGPWVADAMLRRANLIDSFGLSRDHLAELVDTVAACRAHRSDAGTARACYLLSQGYLEHGRVVEAAETLEEALRLLAGSDRTDELLSVRYRLAVTCGQLGEHLAAKKHFSAALELVTDAPDASHAIVWDGLGGAHQNLDETAEAARCYRRAAEFWERSEEPEQACHSWVRSASADAEDRPGEAMAALDRALRLVPSEESPTRTRLTVEVLEIRGYVHATEGRFEQALADNALAAELAGELGQADWQAFFVVRSAQNRLAVGDPEAAERRAREASELLGTDSPPGSVGRVLEILGTALDKQGKPVHTDPLVRELTARLRG